MTARPKAYSYIRMSTDIQLKGDSLRRQLEASEEYAEKNNLELVEDFNLRDIGVSAFKGKNIIEGKLGTFIHAVEAGDIDKGSYLLVESLDRLSRQETIKSLKLFLEILDLGINIITLSDGFEFESGNVNEMQLMMSILIMSRAHEESQMKSKRIGAAWASKRKDPSVKLTKTCPSWLVLNEDRKGFTVLKDKLKIVKRIFELSANGYGNTRIAKKFNKEGVATLGRSKGWFTSTIDKTLRSRAVLGEFQPHKKVDGKRIPEGDPIKDYFPQVISDKLFYEVEAARKQRKVSGAGRKGKFNSNLFSGIAKCGYCGRPMQYVDKGSGPKGGQYLVCTDAYRGLPCVKSGWRYKEFEELFLTFVEELDLKKVLDGQQTNQDLKALEEQITVQTGELAQKKDEQERTFQLFISGGSKSEFISDKISMFDAEIEEIEINLKEQAKQIDEIKSSEINKSKSSIHLDQMLAQLNDSDQDLEDLRTRLSSSIKAVVSSLELFRDGMTPIKLPEIESTEYHPAEKEEFSCMIEFQKKHLQETDNPFFMVKFGDSDYRKVSVDLSNPKSKHRYVEVITQNVWSKYNSDGSERHLRKRKHD